AILMLVFSYAKRNYSSNHVGVIMSNISNPFFSGMTRSIDDALNRQGYGITVISSRDEPKRSIMAMEKLVDRGLKVIIFNPVDSIYTKKELDYAQKNGIKIITVDRESLGSDDILGHIESNNQKGGQLSASYILKHLGKNAKILEIQGFINTSSTQERAKSFDAAIKNGNAEIIVQKAANYNRVKAKHATMDVLKEHSNINAIFAHNDLMALGAADAVEYLGRENIVIVGFDGTDEGIKAIKDGKIDATIKQNSKGIGTLAAEIAVDHIEDGSKEFKRKYELDVELITKENIDKAWGHEEE
ncbi:sugar ABC transporter substrate-binding protein, partial [Cysteiniphilum marinum]